MNNSNKGNLRILFLTPAMGIGGVGRQLYELSTSLDHRGHDVKIVSLTPIGNFGQNARSAGISVMSLDLESKLLAPIALWKIRREIQSFKPDVLHTHLYHAIVMGRLASIGLDVKTISTFHNVHNRNPETERRRDEQTVQDRILSITGRLTDINTFVSDESMERYISANAVSRAKSTRIYNGINVELFSPSSGEEGATGEFVWITVGSLEKRKDHQTLLEAVTVLKDEYDNFTLWILGDGNLRQNLKRKAAHLGIEDHVEFKGKVYDVPKFLNRADAFVLSSRWEGFGLVVAEAMACGLPVVSTDAGGTSEIVIDGDTGMLVERGNSEALLKSMSKTMELSDTERAEYGIKGRQRIEETFSIEKTVESWEAVYVSGIE